MIYEWKKGDRLKVIQASSEFNLGDIVIALNDVSTDSPSRDIAKVCKEGNIPTSIEWYVKRFEKVFDVEQSKIKQQPIKLHLVLIDSCKNFVGVSNNYDEAVNLAKLKSEAVTIYELKEVAKVSTQRIVKKVIVNKR